MKCTIMLIGLPVHLGRCFAQQALHQHDVSHNLFLCSSKKDGRTQRHTGHASWRDESDLPNSRSMAPQRRHEHQQRKSVLMWTDCARPAARSCCATKKATRT